MFMSKESISNTSTITGKNLMTEKKYQWATPLIEGIPPSVRGGHTATKIGRIIIIFGGHYYSGKEKGFTYLNDTHVLDIDNNKWIVSSYRAQRPFAQTT